MGQSHLFILFPSPSGRGKGEGWRAVTRIQSEIGNSQSEIFFVPDPKIPDIAMLFDNHNGPMKRIYGQNKAAAALSTRAMLRFVSLTGSLPASSFPHATDNICIVESPSRGEHHVVRNTQPRP